MMAEQKPPELSMTASVVIILIGAACLLGMMSCKKNTAKPAVGNPELKRSMDELSRKLKDPRVSQCFQAAFAMGKSMRQQGAMRPGDAELHQLGLRACNYFKVPQDMRGVAVDKFKNGFGWGWSSGP
jgi:hypothetical protein